MLTAIAQVIYFCYKLYRIIKRSMSGYWNAKVKVLVGSKEEIEVKFTRKNGNFFNYQNQPEVWILEILGNLMKLCCQNKCDTLFMILIHFSIESLRQSIFQIALLKLQLMLLSIHTGWWNSYLIDLCFNPPDAQQIKSIPLCTTP